MRVKFTKRGDTTILPTIVTGKYFSHDIKRNVRFVTLIFLKFQLSFESRRRLTKGEVIEKYKVQAKLRRYNEAGAEYAEVFSLSDIEDVVDLMA